MEEYYDTDEWGEIVVEETSMNMEARMAPARRLGVYYIFMALVDFILAAVIYYLGQDGSVLEDLPQDILLIVVLAFAISGIGCIIIGVVKLGKKGKRTVVLEKGIVRGTFRHFDNIPLIEVRGPKEKVVVLRRAGSAPIHTDLRSMKAQRSYAFILDAPNEYDFGEFIEALKGLGYGGEEEAKGDGKDGKQGEDDNGPGEGRAKGNDGKEGGGEDEED